jgi:hypothetical protein
MLRPGCHLLACPAVLVSAAFQTFTETDPPRANESSADLFSMGTLMFVIAASVPGQTLLDKPAVAPFGTRRLA